MGLALIEELYLCRMFSANPSSYQQRNFTRLECYWSWTESSLISKPQTSPYVPKCLLSRFPRLDGEDRVCLCPVHKARTDCRTTQTSLLVLQLLVVLSISLSMACENSYIWFYLDNSEGFGSFLHWKTNFRLGLIHNFSSNYSHRNTFPSFYAVSPTVFILSFPL